MKESERTPATPNFFIVGAPKAGTTSLYHYLAQHPDIYMSPLKEPSFFSTEIRSESLEPRFRVGLNKAMVEVHKFMAGQKPAGSLNGIVTTWDDYLKLFAAANHQQAVGEASASYLWSKAAPAAIAARFPRARIIMVLRHPAERAFSHYLYHLSNGTVDYPFRELINQGLRTNGRQLNELYPFLQYGLYSEQVARYLAHFPPGQIHIQLYEELKNDLPLFIERMLSFLEVDADFAPNTAQRHLEPCILRGHAVSRRLRDSRLGKRFKHHLPSTLRPLVRSLVYRDRRSITMDASDRRRLVEYYRDDVRKLELILRRDLSPWLR